MSQNYYQKVSNYFGINTLKELLITEVAVRCAAHAAIPVTPYALHAVHALHAVFEVALFCSGQLAEVHRTIMKSLVKSCSLDPVPTFLLRAIVDLLLSFVTCMVNTSLR